MKYRSPTGCHPGCIVAKVPGKGLVRKWTCRRRNGEVIKPVFEGIAWCKFNGCKIQLGPEVFETTTKNTGWDGRFKGALLPMDVYAYTLEVEFFDGTKTTKTGDITLIR